MPLGTVLFLKKKIHFPLLWKLIVHAVSVRFHETNESVRVNWQEIFYQKFSVVFFFAENTEMLFASPSFLLFINTFIYL